MLTTCVPACCDLGRGMGPIRTKEEVAVDDSGDRSQDALPLDGDESGNTRREFLKKAAVVGLSPIRDGSTSG